MTNVPTAVPFTSKVTMHVDPTAGVGGRIAPIKVTVFPTAETVPNGQVVAGTEVIVKEDGTVSVKFTSFKDTVLFGLKSVIVTVDLSPTKMEGGEKTFVPWGGSGGVTFNVPLKGPPGSLSFVVTVTRLSQLPRALPITSAV